MKAEVDATAREYLLGALPDDRAAALERSLLVDGAVLEHVEQAEEDLIDDYLDDRLSSDERARFERHYLASAVHADRVAVARTLAQYVRVAQAASVPRAGRRARLARALGLRPPMLAWAAVAALVVIATWFAVRPAPLAPQPASPTVADASPTPGAAAPAPPASPIRVALALSPIATRGGGSTPRLVVPQEAAFVDLRLEGVRRTDAHLPVEVRSVSDRLVWTGAADRAPAEASYDWTASVPAHRLTSDDYILTLFDARVQVAARYFFRIVREP